MNRRHTRAIRQFGPVNRSNPAARVLAIVTTATIALVLGMGPAMADDLTPAPASPTDSSTPNDAPSAAATPDPSPTTSAPTDSPTPSADPSTSAPSPAAPSSSSSSSPATTGSGATGGTGSKGSTPQKTLAASLTSVVSNALASQCDPQHTPVLVGNFEIDGNTCVDGAGKLDWDTTGSHVDDGAKDSTAYTQGDSESTDANGWHTGGSSNGKDDITDAWSYTDIIAGDVWTFFAVHRVADNGTTTYDVELNHNSNSAPQRPNRSVGDLLLQFSVNGTGPLAFDKAYSWTAVGNFADPNCFQSGSTGFGWCPLNTVAPPKFFSRTSTDGLFAEGAINLSALAQANGNICTGKFGQMNIRTVASESHTAALQDYVLPFDTNIRPTCGSIVINKFDSGSTPVGGAHFTISPDPTPGSNSPGPVTLVDGGTGDADHTADGVITISPAQAGDYTVVETQAPTGYFLPSTTSIQLTLAPGADQTATFNFHDPKQWQALTATKTAVPTYTASYDWSIAKEISKDGSAPWVADTTSGTPLTKTVPASGNPTTGTLSYRVSATEGARTTSLYKVSGNISVTNPNASAVTANVSDALPGATCLVEGNATDTVSVPAGTTAYPYVCSFAGTPSAGQLSGLNTATVTWAKADYPQVAGDVGAAGNYSVSPTAAYAFGAETTSINKTVTITDDHHVFPGGLQFTWGVGGPVHTSAVYTQSFSTAPGTCSAVLANTATLTGDNAVVLGTDSAYGKLCAAQDAGITRIDARGFKRTYPWSIEKATTTPKVLVSGGAASADYSVTVTAGDGTDSDWAMTGTVTAHNPNDFESLSVTGVPVTYSGGGTCAVTGVVFPVVIPAGGSQDFAYSCNFGGVQPSYSGTIAATVQWDQTAASTPDGSTTDNLGVTEADWTKTLVNNTVTVHDDHSAGQDIVVATLDWATVHAMPNHQDVITYSVALQNLPDGGTCDTKTNTAWVVGDGGVHLDADQNADNNQANVQVCNPVGLSVSDTATGDFTRTYNWKIDKFINTDQKSQTVHIDTYDHVFDYTVIATPLPRVDSGWKISGTIGVDNDNTDPAIAPITVTGVGELLNVGAVSSCTYDKAVPFDLSSGQHADIGFSCTVDPTPTNNGGEPPVYGGTHQGNVTWGSTGTATTASAPVAWNTPTEVDKSISIYDNEVSHGASPIKLGADAVWNAAGTPTTRTYSLDLSVDKSVAGSCAPQFNNLAWLGGDGVTPTARQSAAAAIICVNAAAWTLTKTSATDPDPLMPGGTITYTLTVTHTAGVPAENVLVEDDLSKVLNNTGSPTNVVASAGTPVLVQPGGTLLSWSIPVLSTSATLSYTVQVNSDAWNSTFINAATPQSPGGTCVGDNNCSTTNQTPALPKLTLHKIVVNGKGGVAVSKDWTLTATPNSIAGQSTVTGNGDPTDPGGTLEKDVLPGSYTLGEGGGPAGYSQGGDWTCNTDHVSGNQVTLAFGDDVTCTIVNTQDPVWKIVKTSDPASGTVQPGQQITYTLTPTWVAGLNPTNLNITDDFSGLVGKTSPVVINNPDVTMNANNTFTWHIGELTDQTAPLSYTVTVNADAIGVTLINLVTAPGTNCPPPVVPRRAAAVPAVTPDDCTTVHETPEWTLQKTSDPASGSSVSPGDVIHYTLTVVNTSDAEVSGMHVTDDLSKVLNTATLNETPDGILWTVVGNTLTWNVPDLAPTESAQLMYSVTLKSGAITTVDNIATPVEPTGHCVADGACETVQTPNPLPPVVCHVNCGHVVSPLPNTGGPNEELLLIGLALLGAGGVLILASRRRGQGRYQGRYRA